MPIFYLVSVNSLTITFPASTKRLGRKFLHHKVDLRDPECRDQIHTKFWNHEQLVLACSRDLTENKGGRNHMSYFLRGTIAFVLFASKGAHICI